jgi:hypothetical protein
MNEAPKQYSLLGTIFNYIFYFGPPGKITKKIRKSTAGQHLVGLGDLSIDVFQEVQNERYS